MGQRLSEFSKLRKRGDVNNSNSSSSSYFLSTYYVLGTQLGASPSNPSSFSFLKFSLTFQLQVIQWLPSALRIKSHVLF